MLSSRLINCFPVFIGHHYEHSKLESLEGLTLESGSEPVVEFEPESKPESVLLFWQS